jgi:hypothetical protein
VNITPQGFADCAHGKVDAPIAEQRVGWDLLPVHVDGYAEGGREYGSGDQETHDKSDEGYGSAGHRLPPLQQDGDTLRGTGQRGKVPSGSRFREKVSGSFS